ncbi:RING finger protein [Armadillidium nasatum]|uniref:RING finger protein n=1 Tax=Armadillidium nasatum TaxID=96803 RepID=A0A5N5T3T9_9CRUS|nr:RING finger protein [Armadillidium nasatum]
MGSGISSPINENLNAIHNHLMKHAGADYDIATATTLTYAQFVSYIHDLNKICSKYKDNNNCILVFAVKKGSDNTWLWKATVRIACVKLNTNGNTVESHRLLNIRQFLQVFRRISYECREGEAGAPATNNEEVEGAAALSLPTPSHIPPTVAASIVLKENASDEMVSTLQMLDEKRKEDPVLITNLEECIICLERKPEIILPCCHAYCTPCIEQWWEYCEVPSPDFCLLRSLIENEEVNEKSCPVCRESLISSDDTWVISEVPNQNDVSDEIRKALISYATVGNTASDEAVLHE